VNLPQQGLVWLPAVKDYDALVVLERRRPRLDLFRYISDNFQGIILKLAGNILKTLYFSNIQKTKNAFFLGVCSLLKISLTFIQG